MNAQKNLVMTIAVKHHPLSLRDNDEAVRDNVDRVSAGRIRNRVIVGVTAKPGRLERIHLLPPLSPATKG
jgi:hypothetical protein